MNLSLKPELESFIDDLVERGEYASREEAMNVAVELLRTREAKRESLRRAVQQGIDDIEAGRVVPMTEELIEDICRRGRERLAAKKRAGS